MKPTVVIVGRPNVGKSTLFNRLTRTRDALVADIPGLTRDRHYGHGKLGAVPYLVVDTGGFEPLAKSGIMHEMARQAEQAIAEADVILFVVDGRAGSIALDKEIADNLRKVDRPVYVVVNKTEGMNSGVVVAEFHELGLGDPFAISATHGEGVEALMDEALLPYDKSANENGLEDDEDGSDSAWTGNLIKVAIAGRPNVGKSTLVNAILGEERVIMFDQPGTTRDAIQIDFERAGKKYALIDTAGLRRKGKVFETIEKFSVIKTLQSIEEANVVILVLDARQDISDQDAHIAGFVAESGRALVIAINKWDGLDTYVRTQIKTTLEAKLKFLDFANFHYISAAKAQGLTSLFRSVDAAFKAATVNLATPQLTRVLIDAVTRQTPPRSGLFRPKLRYAHQGGRNPPIIVIHGNALDKVPDAYRRYLEHVFRDVFKLQGTPLRIQFNVSTNPFAGKKPPEQNRRKPKPVEKRHVPAQSRKDSPTLIAKAKEARAVKAGKAVRAAKATRAVPKSPPKAKTSRS